MAGEVTATLSETDYLAANRDWYRLAASGRRLFPGYAFTVALCAGAGAATAWWEGRDIAAGALLFGLLGLLLIGFCYAAGYLVLPRRCRTLFRQQSTLRDSTRFFWLDAGLGFRSERASADIVWTNYYRWAETRGGLLLPQRAGFLLHPPSSAWRRRGRRPARRGRRFRPVPPLTGLPSRGRGLRRPR